MDSREKSKRIAQVVYGSHVLDAQLSEPVEIALRVSTLIDTVGSSILWRVPSSADGGDGDGRRQETAVSPDWPPFHAFVGILPQDQLCPSHTPDGAKLRVGNFPLLFPSFPAAYLRGQGSNVRVTWMSQYSAGWSVGHTCYDWAVWGFALWRLALQPAGWTVEYLRGVTADLTFRWEPPNYWTDFDARWRLLMALGPEHRPNLIERVKRQWLESDADRFSPELEMLEILSGPDA